MRLNNLGSYLSIVIFFLPIFAQESEELIVYPGNIEDISNASRNYNSPNPDGITINRNPEYYEDAKVFKRGDRDLHPVPSVDPYRQTSNYANVNYVEKLELPEE